MIFIDRHRCDEAGAPIRPSRNWYLLAEAATQKAIIEDGDHTADENIYGSTEVRAALEKLFVDKCAYCESKISAVEDWEVEHFRPKGRVAERQNHPGYYWLTYTWENLYPSCTHCNQRRKDKPRWVDPHYAQTEGKLDRFPILNEHTRAMSHVADIHNEIALLIDPCNEDPEEHLTYDIKGQIHSHSGDLKGETTIKVFHLKRRRLRDMRLERINIAVDFTRLLRKVQREGSPNMETAADSFLKKHILHDSCVYAGAARAVLRDPDAFGVELF